jgi:hypothetical protein
VELRPGGDFTDELSMTAPIARADAPAIAQISCATARSGIASKTILRLKMLIESASGVVAEASPGGAPSSSDQFTINYLVFDRDAFSIRSSARSSRRLPPSTTPLHPK